MKLWLRALDEKGESLGKPLLIEGEVTRSGDRPYFRVAPLRQGSRRMKILASGRVHTLMYVDPKSGQPIPKASWPRFVSPRSVNVFSSLSFTSSRLSVYLPVDTPVEARDSSNIWADANTAEVVDPAEWEARIEPPNALPTFTPRAAVPIAGPVERVSYTQFIERMQGTVTATAQDTRTPAEIEAAHRALIARDRL
jgi:hypothetical protein